MSVGARFCACACACACERSCARACLLRLRAHMRASWQLHANYGLDLSALGCPSALHSVVIHFSQSAGAWFMGSGSCIFIRLAILWRVRVRVRLRAFAPCVRRCLAIVCVSALGVGSVFRFRWFCVFVSVFTGGCVCLVLFLSVSSPSTSLALCSSLFAYYCAPSSA